MIKYFKIKGRINRTEFLVLNIALVFLEIVILVSFPGEYTKLLIFTTVLFFIYLLQCVKRFHDVDMHSMFGFLWWIVPILNIVYFILLYFIKGTPGENKYGESSKYRIIKFKKVVDIKKEEIKEIIVEEFNVHNFPEEEPQVKESKELYFFSEYYQPNGEWINVGDIIGTFYNGEDAENFSKEKYLLAPNEGVLKHTLNKGDTFQKKIEAFEIYLKGKYGFENSIEKTEYIEYFKNIELNYSFHQWLVEDGAFVNIGEPVYQFIDSNNQEQFNYSKKSGILRKNNEGTFASTSKYVKMYTVRETHAQMVEKVCINEPNIIIDDFTNSTIIKWRKVSSRYNDTFGINTMSDNSNVNFLFSLNYIDNNDFIIFQFDPKQISPKQFDKVLFLFENGQQIEFELTTNPTSFKNRENERVLKYRGIITKSELELFATVNFKKWKISLVTDRREILGGYFIGDIPDLARGNIQIVIKKFANDYINIVKKTIPNHKPIELKLEEQVNESINDFCFVYLMHDTSNNYYKIGISNKPEYRERTLQSEKPTIEMIATKRFPIRKIAESIEKALHDTYLQKRLRGEWFELEMKDVQHIIETLK